MKTNHGVNLLLILSALAIVGAEEQPVVLLRDNFAGDSEGQALKKDGNAWEVVDDKKEGAKDEGSLVNKVALAGLSTAWQEGEDKTTRVTVCLRMGDAVDSIVHGERFEIRFQCHAASDEKYMYMLQIYQTSSFCLSLHKIRGGGDPSIEVDAKRKNDAFVRDSEYHTYTLEYVPKNTLRVYRDGELRWEKDFQDLDFVIKRAHHDLDFIFTDIEFLFFTPKEGNRWYLDEVEIASVPTISPRK